MPTSDYTPETAEVAKFLLSRTRDTDGNLVGTFDTTTEPTGDDVTPLITEAVDEVASAVGADVPDGPADDPDALRRQAKRLTSLIAAMNIEMSFFSEQVNTDRSPYAVLERRVKLLTADLKQAVVEAGGGEDSGASADSQAPAYSFGDYVGGWDTRRF